MKELGDKLVTQWTRLQGDTSGATVRERWQLAVRLYYVVLEKLVTQVGDILWCDNLVGDTLRSDHLVGDTLKCDI